MSDGTDLRISQNNYLKSGFNKCPNLNCQSSEITGGLSKLKGISATRNWNVVRVDPHGQIYISCEVIQNFH